MAARRSSFRFRLPWSQDSPASPLTPASQPSARPNASTVTSPATRPAPSPATRPAAGLQPTSQATSTTNLSIAETPTSNQPPNPNKNTTAQTPTSPTQIGTRNNNQLPNSSTTPKPSTSKPAGPAPTSTSPASATPDVAGSSAEIKTPVQPSENSPTRVTTPQTTTSNPITPKIAQRPPFRPAGAASSQSPSPKNRVSRNQPQSSSPPQATSKSRVTSQPASPSGAATKSRLSQSPSPSRSAPQSPAMTPTSSPLRKASQVISSKANQGSSNSQMQDNQVNTRSTLPPKSLQETSESSYNSTEALSPIRDKEPVELQTKSDTISESRIRFRDKATQPSVPKSSISGIKEGQSKKGMNGEPKILKESGTDDHETKEVKEVLQESRGKNYGAGEKTIEVQSKQAHIMKVGETSKDHILINPVSNGRQTRTNTYRQRTKLMVADSSLKTAESNEPQIPVHKEIKDNISKVINRVAVGNGKQETEKTPVIVITLAGDNRGASMQLGSDSSTKGGRIDIRRGYKINPDESADATTGDSERSSKRKRSKDATTMEDETIAAYINCNVQGINNSIAFNSSITERDPGVHMLIPRIHYEQAKSTEETRKLEAHKAESSARPARIIKRRCLRGLLLESSDSDPDNPDKPRRHGCRVGCNEKGKITR